MGIVFEKILTGIGLPVSTEMSVSDIHFKMQLFITMMMVLLYGGNTNSIEYRGLLSFRILKNRSSVDDVKLDTA